MTRPLPNLTRIARLREIFLEERKGKRAVGDYWRDQKDVEAYDAVLGARIGWKWDAALAECAERGFARADNEVVLDFGCGAGIAARRFVTQFGAREVLFHDRSVHAMTFATQSMRRESEGTAVKAVHEVANLTPDILLISHVIGELDEQGEEELLTLINRSRRVIMVEPGNRIVARRLSKVRERLLDTFHITAPCPHQAACPALVERNDWCHFFATPPPEVFTDGFWARVARELSIDLRSLPYAFLALEGKDSDRTNPATLEPERLLGRAEITKHLARIRSCKESGMALVEITKRHHPKVWRALKKRPEQLRSTLQERDSPPE